MIFFEHNEHNKSASNIYVFLCHLLFMIEDFWTLINDDSLYFFFEHNEHNKSASNIYVFCVIYYL